MASLFAKLEGALDKVQDVASSVLFTTLEPRINQAIDSRVDSFRDTSLDALPRQCEECLQAGDTVVSRFMSKVLGDHTDTLVAKLIAKLRPAINAATDGISTSATSTLMAMLHQLLGDEDKAQEAGTTGQGGATVTDRGLTEVVHGLGGAVATWGGAAGSLVSNVIDLEGRLPRWEARAREAVHPLFSRLSPELWVSMETSVREAVGELASAQPRSVEVLEGDGEGAAGETEVEQEETPDGASDVQSRGLGTWLQGKVDKVLGKVVPTALELLEAPTQALIGTLVAELEESSMAAAFAEIRQKLQQLHLL